MESSTRHSIGMVVGIGVLLVGSTLFLKPAPPVMVSQERSQAAQSVAATEVATQETEVSSEAASSSAMAVWQRWFPVTTPFTIGSAKVEASLARTPAERTLGLSGTPLLPEQVVKLFIFNEAGSHGIWMKEMQYPLDIIWLDKAGTVVHVEHNVAPETFPTSFSSPVPAWYVVEAVAGFAAAHQIDVGTKTVLPETLQ